MNAKIATYLFMHIVAALIGVVVSTCTMQLLVTAYPIEASIQFAGPDEAANEG